MDKIAHEVRAQEWFCIIQACNASGLSKKQWCEENGVPLRKFFYWQKRIREELYTEIKKKETGLVPAAPAGSPVPAPAFAEIKTTSIAGRQESQFQPDAVITVGGISIQIANTASNELLERIGGTLLHHAV